MGGNTRYVSVPTQSRFYEHLLADEAFYIFAECSFFSDFESEFIYEDCPEDSENTLEEFIENYPDLFQTQEQTERLTNEFKAEVEKTAIRSASFEKTVGPIHDRLLAVFNESQSDKLELIDNIFSGECFDPHNFYHSNYSEFELISLPIVQAGAELLRNIKPAVLFNVSERWKEGVCPDWSRTTDEDFLAYDFWYWKSFYLNAAQSQSIVFVGSC
ncbi:hypothetical protein ACQ4M3_16930 [Leptolyngbya sp. AN03gr2]|uniref:hypothetical protein n=1 Tax=unclassified Leptolyngbya TaxID=2650499 RepID=UPI003D31A169